jgi:cytosine/adenosine deaminase-related metal-dependent hydrolase
VPEAVSDVLIRGGTVVTCDPALGVRPGADVLIRGGRIAAVGRPDTVGQGQGEGQECRVIDAAGCPG